MLEIILFIAFNTFWQVARLHGFGKKLFGTLGDALSKSISKSYQTQFPSHYFFGKVEEKTHFQQLPILPPNILALGKSTPSRG
jgi:hypothetical protein